MATIYLITNVANGKKYVGQTIKSLKWRWYQHCHLAVRGSKTVLHNAIRKHGVDAFEVVAIEICEIDIVNDREAYWIKRFNTVAPNGYNLTLGGHGTRGYRASAKTRKLIGLASKKNGGWTKFAQPAAVKANTGRERSAAERAKIAAAVKKLWTSGEYAKRKSNSKVMKKLWAKGHFDISHIHNAKSRAKAAAAIKAAWASGAYANRTRH